MRSHRHGQRVRDHRLCFLVHWFARSALAIRAVVVGRAIVQIGIILQTHVQIVVDVLYDKIDGDQVFDSSWYDNVRILFRWQAKLLERWLHKLLIVVENLLQRTVVVGHVANHAS